MSVADNLQMLVGLNAFVCYIVDLIDPIFALTFVSVTLAYIGYFLYAVASKTIVNLTNSEINAGSYLGVKSSVQICILLAQLPNE